LLKRPTINDEESFLSGRAKHPIKREGDFVLLYVFDAFLMRERVNRLMEPHGFQVVGSDSLEEAVLQVLSMQPQIILVGDEARNAGIVESLQMLSKAGGKASIVVLSTDARRQALTVAAVAGASDYIVLPVDDDALGQRLLQVSVSPLGTGASSISSETPAVDFQRELDIYFKDLSAPPHGLGMMMAVLFRVGAKIDFNLEKEYQQQGNIYYQGILNHVVKRQTDKFFRYGNQAFLAVLPGATEVGCDLVNQRLTDLLEQMHKKGQLPESYRLATASVFVPEDGTTREDLLNHLTEKIRWAITRIVRPKNS